MAQSDVALWAVREALDQEVFNLVGNDVNAYLRVMRSTDCVVANCVLWCIGIWVYGYIGISVYGGGCSERSNGLVYRPPFVGGEDHQKS